MGSSNETGCILCTWDHPGNGEPKWILSICQAFFFILEKVAETCRMLWQNVCIRNGLQDFKWGIFPFKMHFVLVSQLKVTATRCGSKTNMTPVIRSEWSQIFSKYWMHQLSYISRFDVWVWHWLNEKNMVQGIPNVIHCWYMKRIIFFLKRIVTRDE